MQSGISASEQLLASFQTFVADTTLRGLIVDIQKEALVLQEIIHVAGTFEDDLRQLDGLIQDSHPAYILLRRYEAPTAALVAVAYVPDTANVRQKMLFASTRNTLLRELGTELFAESLFATTKAELTAEGFQKHDHHNAEPAPLTEEERSLVQVREAEAEASRGTSTRASHVVGGVVPFSDEALQALANLKSGTPGGGFVNLVQLAIDRETETIVLANASSSAIGDFTRLIPDDAPRYSFFVFKLFIYTCPTETKIKDRMLYATCRNSVVNTVERTVGLKLEKKVEAASATEIGESQLLEELHPKRELNNGFSRPKRPGRR
ncbi:hypothetical protein EDC01DRAFT_718885 [Geopyxis carbonaria]|nr:hypothetical protein EDC01DRAFT_718885 [Geopyxis carbonaria]